MTTISFTPVAIASSKSKSKGKESEVARMARAKQLFTDGGPVTYVGVIPFDARAALAKGAELDYAGHKVSITDPGILRCILCSGVHTLTDTREEHGSALITIWHNAKTKDTFSLSNTCRMKYVDYLAGKLTNGDVYRSAFPKVQTR